MKILIVSALSQELNVIKQIVKPLKIRDLSVDYLNSGMGNYSTIYTLTKYLEENKIDFVINIGICGYKNKKEDFIQVGRIINFSTQKEIIVPIFFEFGKISSIISSEMPLLDIKELGNENYVDMESFGIEFVLHKFKIPRLILKVPVDKIGKETKEFDHDKALKLLKENINYKNLILETKKYFDLFKT